MDIVSYITKLQTNVFQIRNDDDFADRLNYRYTVTILVAFAIIVSNRQFSESVIKCWVPAYFTSNFEAYANQVCWVSNTFYVNQTQKVSNSEEVRKASEIKYYQWIPFILLIQALFLYIPRILWRMLSTRAGLEMRDLVEAAHSYKSVEKYEYRRKMLDYITENIDQYVSNPRRLKKKDSPGQKIKYYIYSFCCGSGIYLGNYLVTTYFFTKIIYITNAFAQFFLMNEFLGKQFHELGFDILQYITTGRSVNSLLESVYFPKVVMCDFRIREFGHPNFSQRYTIQCVLPINLYNQQIFTILWFWFLLLFIANFYALCVWAYRLFPQKRRAYVKKRLNLFKDYRKLKNSSSTKVRMELNERTRNFINVYLKFDGVFIIRMISILASDIVGTEVLYELWKRRHESDISDDNDDNDSRIDEPDNSDSFLMKVKKDRLADMTYQVPTSIKTHQNLNEQTNSIIKTNSPITQKPNIIKDAPIKFIQKTISPILKMENSRNLSLIEEKSSSDSVENEVIVESTPITSRPKRVIFEEKKETKPNNNNINSQTYKTYIPFYDTSHSTSEL